MKKLYETLQALLKEPPQFRFKYLMFQCPDFILNAVLGHSEIESSETKPWWANYPEVYSRKSENDIDYQPKYQQ